MPQTGFMGVAGDLFGWLRFCSHKFIILVIKVCWCDEVEGGEKMAALMALKKVVTSDAISCSLVVRDLFWSGSEKYESVLKGKANILFCDFCGESREPVLYG